MDKEIVGDRIFSLLVQMHTEKNFLEAKKKVKLYDIEEGHENNNSIGLFVVGNSGNVLDLTDDDVVFYDIENLDLKKFLLDHSEPKKDGAVIMSDTKISDNVFFSGALRKALKTLNLKSVQELLRMLLPHDFSKTDAEKIEVGNKTRTALSIPIVAEGSKTYIMKKSAYKDIDEGTGKVVKFGRLGIEMEFFFMYDSFAPLSDNFFFDDKKTIGMLKTYNYNILTRKIENVGKFVVDSEKLLKDGLLVIAPYPTMKRMEFLLEKLKEK